jgi:hypothetical protein
MRELPNAPGATQHGPSCPSHSTKRCAAARLLLGTSTCMILRHSPRIGPSSSRYCLVHAIALPKLLTSFPESDGHLHRFALLLAYASPGSPPLDSGRRCLPQHLQGRSDTQHPSLHRRCGSRE